MKLVAWPGRGGLVGIFTVLATAIAVTLLPAATGDTIADHVLGQGDFLHGSPNTVDGASLNTPNFIAVDRAGGHLYLSDTTNNRVIGWSSISGFVNGEPADFVLGQPDLYGSLKNGNGGPTTSPFNYFGPEGVAVDSHGDLYVADTGNNRVLEYNTPMSTCLSFPCTGPAPNLVFGQLGDFFEGGCNFSSFVVAASADSLCAPWGLAVDSNDDLYVADESNNRVLEYNTPLKVTAVAGSGDTTADLVFGQGSAGTDFADLACNGPTATTNANFICMPEAVGVDFSGNVYVSDTNNSRILEYNNSGPNPTNAAPNLVLGQGNFTASACGGAVGVTKLCSPRQLSFDSANNLYVADRGDSRVLEYFTPLATTAVVGSGDAMADLVLGEPNLSAIGDCTAGHVVSATTMCAPNGVDLDNAGDVFVADTADNRVLIFGSPLSNGQAAADVLGQGDFTHINPNSVDPAAMWNPEQEAIDKNSNPQHLYVVDTFNQRVLGWNDATSFVNGAPADLVLGQPDFYTGTSATTETLSTMRGPSGVAVDSKGNLYVSDTVDNRVLEFNAPFAACNNVFPCVGGPAALSIGLTGADTETCAATPSATTLCGPKGLALDPNDELFVADALDNRVLGYFTPLSSSTADIVFGQGTATSFTTSDCNHPSSTISASSLCHPSAVASDSTGNIYISDFTNNRVLEYNETNPPSNVTANAVLGQGGLFTTGDCNHPLNTRSAAGLCNPQQIVLDLVGNAFIADAGNERVLEFNSPRTATTTPGSGDAIADRVFGQADNFTASACNFAGSPAASTECGPVGVALDTAGDLFVVDGGNNRILKYDQPLLVPPSPTPTATSTATPTATATATATSSATSTATTSSTPSTTPTPTATATATRTATPTSTPTPTPTAMPSVSVSPPSVSFGTATLVGKTSKPKNVAIKNTSSKKSRISVIVQSETVSPPGGAFALKKQCINKKLAPGKSCKMAVTFSPKDTTPQNATLMIFDNAPGSPQSIMLSGTGKQ